jgi:hypothetical protein
MPATTFGQGSQMRVIALGAALLFSVVGATGAQAQTWSSARGRPALWQITSVDATGDSNWPYGSEDVAGDGAIVFEEDEAGADLRTVYADADVDRLWLRAYVASQSTPSESATAYFFLDADALSSTGGDAASSELWPELEADPTSGGYDRAFAVSGEGSLVGAWRWDAPASEWLVLETQPDELRAEAQQAIDPIRIGAAERGYFQVDVDHAISTLDSSCDGNIFVRIRHDDPPQRDFGDDDDEAWACRSPLDGLGDPIVLREPECSNDDDCPAGGSCVNGVCLFTYECTGDADCPAGERCTGGECIRVVDEDCTSNAMCDGLVCANGSCGACTENGARACDGDLVCSPDGSCIDTDDINAGAGGASGAGAGGSGAGGAAGTMTPPGEARGGAFHCAASHARARALPLAGWSLLALALLRRTRRARLDEKKRSGEGKRS